MINKQEFIRGAESAVELAEAKDFDVNVVVDVYAFGAACGLIMTGIESNEAFNSIDEMRKKFKKTI